MALDPKLIKLLIVEAAKRRGQSPESPDQPELCGHSVNDRPESCLLCKGESILGLNLRILERIARREKVCGQLAAAKRRVSDVANLVCCLERAAHQVLAIPDMLGPWQNDISKVHVGPGLEALQSASFYQVIAEPAEAVSGLIVAESRSGERAKQYIGEARTVAIAALEAEIDRSAGNQGKQTPIRVECGRHEFGQNIQSGERGRVAHQRQVDESLDRAAAELRPDPLVFVSRFLFGWMRRPVDAEVPEVIETDGNGAAALIEGHVQIRAQARDRRSFHRICGTVWQRRQPLLRLHQRAGQ